MLDLELSSIMFLQNHARRNSDEWPFIILYAGNKKASPIFTQTNRMDEQNQQTTPPAITYDPLWGFKEKKQDRPITLVEQDGANCGCFAAGMAVASLIRAPWNVSKSTPDDAPEKYAVAVAKGIEGIAIRDGLSAVGEMFDANSLVTAINTVLQAKECLPSEKAGKYMAKVAQFHTPEQLTELLTRAKSLGVRVLIPYFAGDRTLPNTKPCQPETMYRAHWCCASLVSGDEQKSLPQVHIYEGNSMVKKPVSLSDVFQSNAALSEKMDWDSYYQILKTNHQTYATRYSKELDRFSSFRKQIDTEIQQIVPSFKLSDIPSSQQLAQKCINSIMSQNPSWGTAQKKSIFECIRQAVLENHYAQELTNTHSAVCARMKNDPNKLKASNASWKIDNVDQLPILENANLRGQVILIGKKADASAQASQTAPAGGAE